MEVVGAQLEKLPTAEVHGSNPVIIKLYIKLYTVNCIEKAKNKVNVAGNGPFLIISNQLLPLLP